MSVWSDRYPLRGTISLTRSMGSRNSFRLDLTDESSRALAVEVEIMPEDFANFMSTRPAACRFRFNDSGVVGMQAENKTELVPFDCFSKAPKVGADSRTKAAIKALAPFEVDGWKGEARDLWNYHNREKGMLDRPHQKVAFHRYVRKDKGK